MGWGRNLATGVGQDHHRSGPRAALSNLSLAFADERVTRHVLASGPDLSQEVIVAVLVEHQTAVRGRVAGVVRQVADDERLLAIRANQGNVALRSHGADIILSSRKGVVVDAEGEGDVDLHQWTALDLGEEGGGGEQQADRDQGALFIVVSPFQVAGDSG